MRMRAWDVDWSAPRIGLSRTSRRIEAPGQRIYVGGMPHTVIDVGARPDRA